MSSYKKNRTAWGVLLLATVFVARAATTALPDLSPQPTFDVQRITDLRRAGKTLPLLPLPSTAAAASTAPAAAMNKTAPPALRPDVALSGAPLLTPPGVGFEFGPVGSPAAQNSAAAATPNAEPASAVEEQEQDKLGPDGHPRVGRDTPGEAAAFRRLSLLDENGQLAADGLLAAADHLRDVQANPLPDSDKGAGVTRNNWTWLGPGNIGGRVRSLVIHPTTPATMFAGGVDGGLWKTTNGGTTWAPIDDFMANLAVSTIAIAPNSASIMYAGTGEGFYNADGIRGAGIFKSTDGGTSWAHLPSTNTNSNFYYVNRLTISPDGSTVLAATRAGIFRSIDGGASWTSTLGTEATDVDFNPSDSTRAIASGYAGNAFYSTNGGASWTPAAGLPGGSFVRVEIAYARSQPTTVYASADLGGGHIYVSTDGGANFTLRFNGSPDYLGGQGWYDNALWVNPLDPNFIIVGGIDLYKSTDGGTTLFKISNWQHAPSSAHADHHIIVASPTFNNSTDKTVFFGNDGGIYKATDVSTVGGGGGANCTTCTSGWVNLNNNLGITQFYGGAGHAASGKIIGGTQDNGSLMYTTAGGVNGWTTTFGGDGGWSAVDPTNANNLFGEYINLTIHRSLNGGSSTDWINGLYWNGSAYVCKAAPFKIGDGAGTDGCSPTSYGTGANFIAPFILDPNDPNRLLAGGQRLWRTNDVLTPNTATTGPSWASIKPVTTGSSNISAIAVAKLNSDVIWVGHNNGDVYKTTNGTAATPTWVRKDTTSPALPNRYVTRITVDPSDTNVVYVAFGGFSADNLYRSMDGGDTWASVVGSGVNSLPAAPIRDLRVHPTNSSWLYAATEVGLFTSENAGVSWTVPNDGPANVSVDELFFMGSELVAVTHGRGMFKQTPSVGANVTVSGVVTNAATSANLANISINFFTANSTYVGTAVTGVAGTYAMSVPPGTYYVSTFNNSGFINKAYNNITCDYYCPSAGGTPLTVGASGVSGINFALTPGGTVSGIVTVNGTGAPLQSINVQLYNSSGSVLVSVATDASGAYSVSGVAPGTYYARTFNSQGYINQLFNGTTCLSCTVTSGTPIVVTGTATTGNVNFALVAGGRISGTVTNAITSAVLPNISVLIHSASGTFATSGFTNASGNYTTGDGLPPGTYYAVTSNSQNYVNELYNEIPCAVCTVTNGSPITVSGSATTTGINFTLVQGGSISGVITNAATSAPLPGAYVSVYNSAGTMITGTFVADASGVYTTNVGLPSGTYYVRTSSLNGFVNELYDNIRCAPTCGATAGTPVTVTSGSTTSGINFALAAGNVITGTVTNAGTGQPISNLQVAIYDSAGVTSGSVFTNASGVFTSMALASGTYYVRTFNSLGLVNQVYNGVSCSPNCSVTSGTPIAVSSSTVSGINLALPVGGVLTGTVTNSTNGQPLASVQVNVYNPAGFFSSATTNASGVYTMSGLSTGSYYLVTSNSQAFLDERYNDLPALGFTNPSGTAVAVTAGATTSGINFALTPGGSISGVITASGSGTPLSGVVLWIYNSSGTYLALTTTNSSGAYTTTGLPAGTYFLIANDQAGRGLVDELYNNILCAPFCSPTTGTPITVTAGANTSGIDFVLDTGGVVSGTVTDAATGQPLAGVSVFIYNSSNVGSSIATQTNAGGVYVSKGLATGTYYAITSNTQGYVNERYDDFPCTSCTANQGTPISVTAGATTSGINFALAVGGRISGTVTASGTGSPLQSVTVSIYSSTGAFVTSTSTNASGTYTTGGLQGGTYFARTTNNLGYVNKLFDNQNCVTCTVTAGTPITVTVGAQTNNVNFVLSQGGSITGTVTNASTSAPITPVSVEVYDATGIFIAGNTTNASGVYTFAGLTTGNYFVRTFNSLGYVNELYNDITCNPLCTTTAGTPIAVTMGAVTSGINIALAPGGSISGVVTNASTGAAVSGISVAVVNAAGSTLGSALTNASGVYTVGGLTTGTYYARTISNTSGLINEIYNDIPCAPSCGTTSGTAIAVTVGVTTSGINFALAPGGGTITGTVTNASTGAPVANALVTIWTPSGFGTSVSTNASGVYTSMALPTGNYYASTSGTQGLVNERYNDQVCGFSCNATAGTPISVTLGNTTSGINFALSPGGSISGVITNASTSAVLPNIGVTVFNSAGQTVATGASNSSGVYTVVGLPPGNYLVRTTSINSGFINKIYNDLTCAPSCDFATGTLVAVTPGNTTSGINFALSAGGGVITGVVTSASTGQPISGIGVHFYNAAGYGASVTTSANGAFTSMALPAGTYYARTGNNIGYLDERYNDLPCVGGVCAYTSGTAITVTAGGTTSGINFALAQGGMIGGSVTLAGTGAALQGVNVDIYTSAGVYLTTGLTGSNGTFLTNGLTAGTYYARTSNNLGYPNRLYNNLACDPSCTVTTGTPITVTVGSTTNNVNFVLAAAPSSGLVSGTITNASTTAALQGVQVNFHTSSGHYVTTATSAANGTYSVALAPGTYFAGTANNAGFINRIYNNISCDVNCSVSAGNPIVVTSAGVTGINFALTPGGGRIAGTITAASNGAALNGISVYFYRSNGNFAGFANSDASGNYIIQGGLSTGNYYARTFNTQGYVDEQYDNIPCFQCSATSGTPVAVTLGNTTSNINFALAQGGRVSGRVTSTATSLPLQGINVQIRSASNSFITSIDSDASGNYTLPAVLAGTYYIQTFNRVGYVDEVYNNVNCPSCQVTIGAPISVTVGSTVPNINFDLATGGRVTGRVTNSANSAPLPNISVSLYNSSGGFVAGMSTDASGNYEMPAVPSGTYYSRTFNQVGFIDEAYNEIQCLSCFATIGTPFTVNAGATVANINFTLTQGGQISGRVTSASTTAPLSGVSLSLYNGSNAFMVGVSTDASGNYLLPAVPAGTYYLRTFNSLGYLDEAYNDIPCLNCQATIGTPISVTVGGTVSNVNFALTPGGRFSGRVTDAATTAPLVGVNVSIYNSSGSSVGGVNTDASGNYTTSAFPAGTYFARTFNSLGYVDELYNEILCSGCTVTTGTPITVSALSTTPNINFTLGGGGRISGRVTAAATTAPLAGVNVWVFNSANTFIASGVSDASGNYTTASMPAGTYYARTSNNLGYVEEAYNEISCPGCQTSTSTPITVPSSGTVSNINFTLAAGGRVSGRVTNAANSQALSNISVQLYDPAGQFVASINTDASGNYVTNSVLPGTYYARTQTVSRFINKLYNDISCPSCTVTTGAALTVTAGATLPNINFALNEGGQISGRVTNATTTAPLSNLNVQVYNGSGTFITGINTDASGNYTTNAMPPGTYYARTNSNSFINELYNEITCAGCNVATGTPITVTLGGVAPNINFTLTDGGRISGRVTNAANSLPLSGINVQLYTSTGAFVSGINTDASGNYTSSPVPSGTYYAKTSTNNSFINELYNELPCTNCLVTTGTAITITAGSTTANINFTLTEGGRISGRVTDAGTSASLAGVNVSIFNGSGSSVMGVNTDASGNYTTSGLPAGTYYARTFASTGHVDELYQEITCTGCLVTSGTPITVTAGGLASNINFTLTGGGRISGRVTNAATSAPIASANVSIYNSSGSFMFGTNTDASGNYTSGGVPAGTYFARASSSNFVDELYNDIPCTGCIVTTGTPISVTVGNTTANINFTLASGGRISGRVTNAATTAPLTGISINIFNASGTYMTTAQTDASGNYTSNVLPAGSYFARTSNTQGYEEEQYSEMPCNGCSITSGTPIAVTAGSTTGNINFTLTQGSRVTGRVTNAANSAALANVSVSLYSTSGAFVTGSSTDASGNYSITVAAGTYYARTFNSAGFIEELYNEIPCVGCTVTTGTPITVALGGTASNINFTLTQGGRVTGRVTNAATTAALANIGVSLFNSSGTFVTGANTDASGNYTTSGVPAGTYFAKTNNGLGFVDELYNEISCPSCNVTTGTPIVVTVGGTNSNINFTLAAGGTVSGRVTNAANSNPLANVNVGLYNSSNAFIVGWNTDASGNYTISVAPGTYYARTFNTAGFIDELYNDIACSSCSVTTGTAIVVTTGGTVPNINFALAQGGRISGRTTAASNSANLASISISIYNSTGTFVAGTSSDASGNYTTSGLPAGNYFVRTFNQQSYIDEVFNDIPCASCLVTTGTPVAVTVGSTAANVNFALTLGGRVSGRVTNASTTAPLGSLAVGLYNNTGTLVTTTFTDASGNYTSNAVPAGTYYSRTNNGVGFIDEAFNEQACAPCAITSTTPITVTAGAITSNVSFTLTQGGRISGVVTNATTSALLSGIEVEIYSSTGVSITHVATDASGAYATRTGLPAGNYFARTNTPNFVNKLYNNITCIGACNVTTGNPIAVTVPNTTTGINFALNASGATISAAPATVPVGGQVTLTIANGPGNTRDWVELRRNGVAVDWWYLNGTRTAPASGLTSATFAVTMPTVPGTHDFRFLENDGQNLLATSNTVTVNPTLSINDVSVAEGNSGNATATFTVTLSAASAQTVTVNFATANGTATAGSDYVSNSNLLTFAPGTTTQTIAVSVIGDTTFETNETFLVNLTSPTNATITRAQGQGTITNDDAVPALSVNDVSVTEGNSGTTVASFSVTLSNSSSQAVTVNYATADGTATTAGTDYQSASGTLTFAPGVTSQTIAVTVTGDTTPEANETFTVTLATPANATINRATGTGTITNDDGAGLPSLSVNDVSVTEGNSGTTAATFAVTLSAASAQTVTVNYATANGTATAGTDYQTASGTLTFAPGVTTQNVVVTVNGDAMFETGETFTVTLASATNATINRATGTATITNDDTVPTLSINDVSAAEGNSGTSSLTFAVTLSNPTSQVVTVNYATANGTATAGTDYVAKTDTLTIPAGVTSQNLVITVNGDTTSESNETFTVTLASPSNATLNRATGTGTITNDDGVPTISAAPASVFTGGQVTVTVGNGPGNRLDWVTMRRAGITVDWWYLNGTRTPPAPGGGLTAASFPVTVPNVAGSYTFQLQENDGANVLATSNTVTATTPPMLNINDVAVAEGNSGTTTATFTVTLSAASSQTVTVNYATSDNTATVAGNDYVSRTGTLTFAPSVVSQTIAITVNGDTATEPNETFTVTLSSPSNAAIGDGTGIGTITNDDLPSITAAPTSVVGGGQVTLTIANGPANRFDWINVRRGGAPVDWWYLSGTKTAPASGVANTSFAITLPTTPGVYDFVLQENDGNVVLATSNTVTATAPPTLSINDVTVAEGNTGTTTATFTVTLSAASAQTVTVNYATSDNTATAGSDYVARTGTLTFAPSVLTQTVAITVNGDTATEPSETFTMTLSSATNAAIADGAGIGTITNDDVPTITASPSSVFTGGQVTVTVANGPANRLDWVTMRRSGVAVDWFYLNGTKTPPAPGGGLSNTSFPMTIPATVGSYTFQLQENDGNVVLATSNTVTATAGPTLSINDVAVAEGNSGTTTATFTVTLSTASAQTVTVNYATSNNTATAGSDYVSRTGTLTFAPSVLTQTIAITINGDTATEPNETYTVTLSSSANAGISDGTGIGTITNDDLPSISAAPTSVVGGGQVTLTIANGPANRLDWINVRRGGTPVDWWYLSGTKTAPASGLANTSFAITLPTTPGVYDFVLQENDGNVVLATSNTVTATAPPTLSINDVTVAEGNSGTTTATFAVTLSAASAQTVTVNYATANNTATAGSDYVSRTGTLTFAPGVTSQPIAITINGDTATEPNETYTVTLSSPANAAINDGLGIGTITNDDVPTITASPSSVFTGGQVTVTVANGPANRLDWVTMRRGGVAVDWFYLNGTKTPPAPGGGLSNASFPMTIPATVGSYTFHLQENDGNVVLANSNTVTATAPPTLNINDVTVAEGNAGTTTATFTVTLSTASAQTVTVNYATANNTATAGSDYVGGTGTLTFAPGVTSQPIAITINGDTATEPNETYTVTLSSPANAAIGDGLGIGTITNDDVPTISAAPTSVVGGGQVTLTIANGPANRFDWINVRRAGAAVDWWYLNGTKTAPASGLANTSVAITLPSTPGVYDFLLQENDGNVVLATSNTVTATAPPTLNINDVTVAEGNAGTTTATFTVTLSTASAQTVTVNYATANNTATAGSDYVARTGTLTFTPGVTSQPIAITINGDTAMEPSETYTVTLSSPTNAAISDGLGIGTITNDDVPTISAAPTSVVGGGQVTLTVANGPANRFDWINVRRGGAPVDWWYLNGTKTAPGTGLANTSVVITLPTTPGVYDFLLQENDGNVVLATSNTVTVTAAPTLSINDVAVVEGNSGTSTATFTVTLSSASAQTVTVNYATANNTATAGSDYVARTGTLTFAPGVTSQPIAITINGDTGTEPNETYTVTLSSPANAAIGDGLGVGTITNDDVPTISAAPSSVFTGGQVTVTVANGPANRLDWVTMRRSGAPVDWFYLNGSKTAPATGLSNASFPMTIPATAGSYTFHLQENDGNVILATSNTVTATALPTLSINDVTAAEGNSGMQAFTFTVTLSAASAQTVTVGYATANGTATSGSDYNAIPSGTLTFNPGTTSQTFGVVVLADTVAEANETFTVNLGTATNATIADGVGVGTITNDDGTVGPTIASNLSSVGPAGMVTVTLSGGPGNARDWIALRRNGTNVDWFYLNGTKTPPTSGSTSTSQGVAMPTIAGTYDFTFNLNDASTLTAVSGTVTVTAGTCSDTDADRLCDNYENNTGSYVSVYKTGTNPTNGDTDGDSLRDGDEVLGTTAGLDLPGMGASPLKKNILFEYDWVDDSYFEPSVDGASCGAHSHRPTAAAIDRVTAAFAASPLTNPDGTTGIRLIHDYGQGGLFTGGGVVSHAANLTGGVNGADFNSVKTASFASNRNGYFHYVFLPHWYTEGLGSSGQAELPGDDLIVSLGCFGSTNNVANTIMHEAGHNFNIRHGGNENCNWKPNYNSVMNYRFQFPGVDTSCNAVGNSGETNVLDFSRGTRIPLNETNLNENVGTCGSTPIDWNFSGTLTFGLSYDLNRTASTPSSATGVDNFGCTATLQTLTDNDDWAMLSFAGLTDGDGNALTTLVKEIITETNPIPRTPVGQQQQ